MFNSLQPHGLYSPPDSSVHGVSQASVLEWVAISFSRGIFPTQGSTWVSHLPGRHFNRWRTVPKELYQKDLHNPDNHDDVITHLEPDILECEVKWALGSTTTNKTTGGYGIPAELFQILRNDAVNVLHSICQKIWKISSGHRTGKGQFSFQSQRKAMPKNAQTTAQLHSSHTLVK